MKPIKILLASMFVGVSAFAFTACSGCDSMPTWLGGKEPTYTVVIHIDGVDTEMEVTEDAIPEKPQDPVKEGYNFRGWYLDPAGEQPYNFDTPLNADSTLYALFDEKEYQVTFVVDGVSDVVTFKWSQTPSYATPKKDGYVFKAWCLDEELTQDYAFIVPVREDLTVYAKFAEAYKVQYVVTPNVNEEEEGGVNTEIVETEKETAPIKPQDPKVEGYTFEGWFLDKEFTQEYNFDEVLEEGATIYAKLVEKQYVVTYVVGGTETVLSEVTYDYWDVPEEPATPEYQGEYFFGWYLDEAYANSYDFSYTLKTDTTVYAQFLESKPIYTADELQAIADYPAGNYALMNDIILAGKVWTPITTFSGKLNGNGYKLIALTLSSPVANAGFIQTNTGTIKNLTLENYSFTANYSGAYVAGALVGTNKGTIENCSLQNVVESYAMEKTLSSGEINSYFGGMVGCNESGAVLKNCSVCGKINVSQKFTCNNYRDNSTTKANSEVFTGGIVGYNNGTAVGLISCVDIIGTTKATGYRYTFGGNYDDIAKAYLQMGGIIGTNAGTLTKSGFEGNITTISSKGNTQGYNYLYLGGVTRQNSGSITECYAKGTITETAGSCDEIAIGGFVQNNSGMIKDCYADMDITTGSTSVAGTIGGFVSVNCNPISTCYATGSITTGYKGIVGGFVASNNANGTVNLCFSSVDISSEQASTLGVFVGYVGDGSAILISRYNSESSVLNNGEAYTSTAIDQVSGLTAEELYSTANILDTLYWNTDGEIWIVDGVNAPTLAWETPQE